MKSEFNAEINNHIPGVGKSAKISGRDAAAIWAVVGATGIFILYAANGNGFPEGPNDDGEGLFMKIIKLFKRDPLNPA